MKSLGNKKLGVCWGASGLYFIETTMAVPRRMFFVPFPRQGQGAFKPSRILPESVQFVSTIQQAFAQNDVAMGSVNLSLPASDIIFRTFVIPWMKVSEVKGVVGFEAMKYIPFDLNDLYYAYYPQTITEDNVRKIRVIFVAIKKDVLEGYRGFLEQIGLKIDVVEPATLSLIRVLQFKKIVNENQSVVVLENSPESGKVIVVDNCVPQFVREFQLVSASSLQKSDKATGVDNTRLVNETRISLDYFGRQDSRFKIKQLNLIGTFNNQELAKILEENLSVKVSSMDSQDIIGTNALGPLEYVHAYGIGLIDDVKTLANFNLSPSSDQKSQNKHSVSSIISQVDYKKVGIVAALCVGVFALAYVLTGQKITGPKSQLESISVGLGEYKSSDTEKLSQRVEDLKTKLDSIKDIRLASDTGKLLEIVPQLLPAGAWLKNLEISYLDSEEGYGSDNFRSKKKKAVKGDDYIWVRLNINGYVYSENTKEQFVLVDKYVGSLRGNELFKKTFKSVDLDQVKLEPMQDYTVTYFEILCQ